MSRTTPLVDILKLAQTVSSPTGLLMMLANASGVLSKMKADGVILNFGVVKDLDQCLPTGFYQAGYPLIGSLPGDMGAGSLTFSMLLSWTPSSDYSIQLFARATLAELYVRNYIKGTFTVWKKLAFE